MSSLSGKMSRVALSTKSYPSILDIGANLTDDMFLGQYGGKDRHPPDFHLMLSRSLKGYTPPATTGPRVEACSASSPTSPPCDRIIITAGNMEDVESSLNLATSINECCDERRVYTTVGVHPTRCSEIYAPLTKEGAETDGKEYLLKMIALASGSINNKQSVVAVGELGLDYDRTKFCSIEVQKMGVALQLDTLCPAFPNLPLFIHDRNCGEDLLDILLAKHDLWKEGGGVVHSFDGSLALAHKFLDLGLYIGLNGASFRTVESLAVVKELPLDRILVETDAPWCDIRPTHPSYQYVRNKVEGAKKDKAFVAGFQVKGRNEPGNIRQVLEVIAGVKGIDVGEVGDKVWQNSMNLFFKGEREGES